MRIGRGLNLQNMCTHVTYVGNTVPYSRCRITCIKLRCFLLYFSCLNLQGVSGLDSLRQSIVTSVTSSYDTRMFNTSPSTATVCVLHATPRAGLVSLFNNTSVFLDSIFDETRTRRCSQSIGLSIQILIAQ